MKKAEYTHDDFYTPKSTWGPGAWQDEPDKVQWEDRTTHYPCVAIRNDFGAWCGYVGVSKDHPCWEMHYDSVFTEPWENEYYGPHGGLTFSDWGSRGPKEKRLNTMPWSRVWWLGFDCAHAMDYAPAMAIGHGTYRTLEYVKQECIDLAAQLKRIKTEGLIVNG